MATSNCGLSSKEVRRLFWLFMEGKISRAEKEARTNVRTNDQQELVLADASKQETEH